jgi:prohibitin 2
MKKCFPEKRSRKKRSCLLILNRRKCGESQAIKIITEQLRQSPQYLQWQAINRWNGQMPYALGSSGVPFFQLPTVPQLQQNQTAQSNQTR